MTNEKRNAFHSVRPSATLTSGCWRAIGLICMALAAVTGSPAQDEQVLPDAVKFKTLFYFDGTDGQYPSLNLVQGLDGNLYGTTDFGGASGYGVFFKLTPDGRESTLYNFCPQPNCADGGNPNEYGSLALDPSGDLYGTTNPLGVTGYGTIFKITPSGALSTLYSFCGSSCGDQGYAFAGVVRGPDGSFYGVTDGGGNISSSGIFQCFGAVDFPETCGLAYRITPEGAFSVIYNFCSLANCADGGSPLTQLILGTDENLYGITEAGGANGLGTVFKLTLGGKLTTLYSFSVSPCGNGNGFCAPLVQANNGNFYGTTYNGGVNGAGAFFEITPSGTFTTLYNFCSKTNCADGAYPVEFVQGTDGNFYGVTSYSGSSSCGGTVFEITAQGALTTLHRFNGTDGCEPVGLVQHTNGAFYGEMWQGGNSDNCGGPYCGTLFSLSVGLKPFVKTLELSGKVSSTVQILGDGLSSATAVSFNGVAAAFTVESDTLISATVPAGATTGFVVVSTSSGTLTSNVRFHIR